MPSVKDWVESLPEVNSRDPSCQQQQQSFTTGSSTRCVSEACFFVMDANNSQKTLANALEMETMPCCDPDQPRQRQLSTASAASREQDRGTEKNTKDRGSIKCRVDYCVVQDDRFAEKFGNYTGIWAGDTGNSVPRIRSRYFGDHVHQNAYFYKNKT
ncbi:hypothetical protein E4U43_001587 [Claviceps pusilla]|uniref:Uncharacterized protein n=1 Tax=Claviceps pusilla TaxID=123648 RepID=A0A9P7N7G9_9HYPO|nr:hypothetical protein E4U43_001587 [Claviceps pusilla]